MSDRIRNTFERVKKRGGKALVGYLTAGDPDMRRSEADIRAAIRNGVDVLELGVPFSDPTADGPVIQAASLRSLASGANVKKVLELVRSLRRDLDIPIILFGYANPFFSYGYKKLCTEAAAA
ncbi:MAG: tryptophan synthase subunit alpha, partial [bacterium]